MKKQLIVGILIMVIAVFSCVVEATGENITPNNPYDPGKVVGNAKDTAQSAWATISFLIQMAAVACVVFAGLRYMFSSSDQKADIKQGLIYLVIGAILVFCAIPVINFVVEAANQLL